MRVLFGLLACSAMLVSVVAGCGPKVAEEDLGQIVFEIPEVPGAEKPYDMPELGPAPPRSESDLLGIPPLPH